jgi:hypothetical protein
VGAAFFIVFVGAAGVGVLRARASEPSNAALTAGGATGFAYWMLHSSVDWLWEFPALGASAFMFLGLAVSGTQMVGAPGRIRLIPALATSAIALSFIGPWLAANQVDRAASVWRTNPHLAYTLLHQAARLNPLSDAPAVVEGTIAAQRGDATRMQTTFERALRRDRNNWFSYLQLSVAQAHERRWGAAIRSARHAQRLNPGEPLVQTTLASILHHHPQDLRVVNTGVYGQLRQIDPALR